jgi:DNA-binding FadR family transcriptional regulator
MRMMSRPEGDQAGGGKDRGGGTRVARGHPRSGAGGASGPPRPQRRTPQRRTPEEPSAEGTPGRPDPVPAGLELTAVLGPVRAGNAFEETVERLLTVIKLGVVGPGEKFPAERDLAVLLGISRITLREAIRALQQAGYVEPRRGRFGGTFVTYTRPSPSRGEALRIARDDRARITDALTFRMAIETGAAQVLAQPGTEIDRDLLLARLAGVNNAAPDEYRRMDTLFHLAIAELTGSSLLAAACADARMRLNDLLNAIPVLQRNIDHTAAQHTAIVEAILAGDAGRARRAVAEHLDGTGALLRGFLSAPG